MARAGDDFVALDLTAAAFDLSDRGVEGLPHPGPLDAFAWTDRGIYRPGETVQVMALLRDAAGPPADVPAHVVIKRPNGQVFLDQVPPRGPDAARSTCRSRCRRPRRPGRGRSRCWPTRSGRRSAMPSSGSTRSCPTAWRSRSRRAGPIVPGHALPAAGDRALPVWRAGRQPDRARPRCKLVRDPNPPAALAGYRIGLDGEEFAPDSQEIDLPNTDPQGKATLPILLKTRAGQHAPGAGASSTWRWTTRPAAPRMPMPASRCARPAT